MLRRRPWFFLSALALLTATLSALPAATGRDPGPCEPPPPLLVTVHRGDSLWTIARDRGDPDRDIRDIVWHIRRANDVDPGRLRPGDTIRIPAECLPPAS